MKIGDVIKCNLKIEKHLKKVVAVKSDNEGLCLGCVFYENGCKMTDVKEFQCWDVEGNNFIFKGVFE